jgi:haloacetate dehalogenase
VVGRRPESPLDVWSERALDVRGTAVDAGHFLVEERPAETLDLLQGFLAGPLQ